MQKFDGKTWDKDHLEDLGVDGKIILKLILEKRNGGMNWIDLGSG